MIELEGTDEFLFFDAVDSETINYPTNVTDHPIEDFEFVTDHRQVLPYTIEIDAEFTADNYPGTAATNQFGEGPIRLKRVREFFDEWADAGTFTYFSHSLGIFENLLIEEHTLEAEEPNRIAVNLSLKHVRIGRTQFVELPPIQNPEQEIMLEEGRQEGEEPEDTEDEVRMVSGAARGYENSTGRQSERTDLVGGLTELTDESPNTPVDGGFTEIAEVEPEPEPGFSPGFTPVSDGQSIP